MRVLHILDHSLPLQSGYVYRTLGIVEEQRRLGWAPYLLTSGKHYAPGPPIEQIGDWQFFRTPMPSPAIAKVPVLRDAAIVHDLKKRIAQLITEIRPDILHAHSPVLNALPAIRVGQGRRLPVVYEVRAFWEDAAASHGTHGERDLRYQLTRAVESWALRRADAVTTICEGLRQDIVRRGIAASKITVIPNAVDRSAFRGRGTPDVALAASLGLSGKTVLGFLGSFYHYEGLHLLLQALPALRRTQPDIAVLLVGGGPENERLQRLAGELGLLHQSVVFTGRVDHEQVKRYYDLVDLLVFPRVSMRLTQLVTPLKPLEAMAQEQIVVASDVGGHRELIRDGETGNLFKPDDPLALAQRVLDVLGRRDEWPAVRDRALRYVDRERSWAVSVARYKGIYESLLARASISEKRMS